MWAAGRSHAADLWLGCLGDQAWTPCNHVAGRVDKITLPLLAPYSLPPCRSAPRCCWTASGSRCLAAWRRWRLATTRSRWPAWPQPSRCCWWRSWSTCCRSWAGGLCGQGGVVGRVVLWAGAGAGVLTLAACQSGGFGPACNVPVLCSSPAQRRTLLASPTATPQTHAGAAADAASTVAAIAGQQRVPPAAPQPVVASPLPDRPLACPQVCGLGGRRGGHAAA